MFVCTFITTSKKSDLQMKNKLSRSDTVFHAGTLEAQAQYGDQERARRIIEAMPSIDELDGGQIDFIEKLPFFFLATSDEQGHLQCSFKGGGPGILIAQDARTLCYPEFPGNDMMLSVGNIFTNPHVGLLAISFENRRRLKINGKANVQDTENHPMQQRWPEARLIVDIEIDQIIRNCSRRIPRMIVSDGSS